VKYKWYFFEYTLSDPTNKKGLERYIDMMKKTLKKLAINRQR